MNLSQKCQYAVRALLELSKRHGQGPVSTAEAASSQAVPQRFLEVILNELKSAGFVESRRGVQGGYLLAREPAELTVGEVIRAVDGPLDPVKCTGDRATACCPLKDRCSLIHLWNEAKEAVEQVYDRTTFQHLVDQERELERRAVVDYSI